MSMSHESVWVAGVGLWLPEVTSAQAFVEGVRGLNAPRDYAPPGGRSIEPRARRRASRLSRAMADACAEAVAQAGVDPSRVATVFGSALGEATTMIALLDQMWRGQEMSPMGFATSVHSAASGVVSISSGNRGFTTSLSADFDTAAAALTEAWGWVQTQQEPAVLVCGDDDSPKDFVPDAEAFDLMAAALCLVPIKHPPSPPARPLARLSLPEQHIPDLSPVALSPRVSRNPQAALVDLAAAILQGDHGWVRLDRGLGSGYCVHLETP